MFLNLTSSAAANKSEKKIGDTPEVKEVTLPDPKPAILRSVHTNPDMPPYPGQTVSTNQPKQEQPMSSHVVKDESGDLRDTRDSRTPERCKLPFVTSSSSSITETQTKGVKLPSPSPPKTAAGTHCS